MNKLKTSTKLYILVSVLSFFMIAIGFFGIHGMQSMDENTKTLFKDRVVPLQQLTQIRYIYNDGIKGTSELLTNKLITTDQALERIIKSETEIKTNWELYLKTYLTPQEIHIVEETKAIKYKADQAIQVFKEAVKNQHGEITNQMIDRLILLQVNPLIKQLNNLVQLQVNVSNELYQSNDELYIKYRNKFYLFILISFFVALIMAYYIISDTKGFIKKLNEGYRKINESEEKYRYLFQNSPAFIIIWDLETLKVLEVNNVVVQQYGYNIEEWFNMSVFVYRPEVDHEKILSFAQKMLNNDIPVSKMQWTHLKKNGEEMLMEITSHKMMYKGRKAILSLANDITEQEKTAEAFKKSEEKFRSLINHAADAIFMVLDNGEIFDVNQSATKLLQYSKAELIGRSVLDLYPENVREKIPEVWEQLRKEKSLTDERLLQRKDGTLVEVEISRNMLQDGSGAISIVRDITERNIAIKKIKESEERVTKVLQNSPIPLTLTLFDHTIIFINHQFTKIFGYELIDIPDVSTWWLLAYPDETYREKIKNEWNDRIERYKAKNIPFEPMEAEVSCKDGSIRNIEFHFADMDNEYLVSFYDITARKKAERNLKQSEERNRALVENIDDGILLINENFHVIYQSPSVERIIGYTIEDRIGKIALDYIHPEDTHICIKQYEQAQANPGQHTQSQYRTLHKNGHYIWIEIFIVNMLKNESINSYIVIYRDITESKKFEEQQLLMSSIVNTSYDAIISKTIDGVITSWNFGAKNILGYTEDEMLGNNILKIIPPELKDEELNIHKTIVEGHSVSHFETKRLRKDGQTIDVSLTVSPIKDSLGNVVGASKVLRDISERKKAENQLKEHNKKLSEIAFLQSHIVRRPVANVIGIVNFINKEDPTDPINFEMIPMLEIAVKELDDVIHQIVAKTKEIV